MKAGDRVKFATPHPNEREDRFVVLELRGDRVLVRDDNRIEPISPAFVYLITDLVPA